MLGLQLNSAEFRQNLSKFRNLILQLKNEVKKDKKDREAMSKYIQKCKKILCA